MNASPAIMRSLESAPQVTSNCTTVQCVSDIQQLTQSARDQWNELAEPSPMQSPDWLLGWWANFGSSTNDRLCVLLIYLGDRLVGVAPWYLGRHWTGGYCLRFLGDGITCTDHSTILVDDRHRSAVLDSIAQWVWDNHGQTWQTLYFASIDESNTRVNDLVKKVSNSGCSAHQRWAQGRWEIELPDNWEHFLSLVSKNHRKRCRRWRKKYFESGLAKIECTDLENFDVGWNQLVELNLERRSEIGDRSCFVDQRFLNFQRDILFNLLDQSKAQLRQLVIDGHVKAVEYVLQQGDTLFCYQSGMRSCQGGDGYGNLSLVALMFDAIASGMKKIDFLCGDEGYKKHWGAKRIGCVDYQLAAPGTVSGNLHMLYSRTKDWLKSLRDSASTLPEQI